ncbi:Tar ligand binding domain-containing protein [Paraburkholderia sp. IW21]|uniref:Tar ligand binding domain-containing protein n=1 Tax=Paraburkholderia sp. IW21 TaxID=3242488 RepID=UPI0035222EAC
MMTKNLTINLRIAITIAFLGLLLIAIGTRYPRGDEINEVQRDVSTVHFASVVALGKSGTAMSRTRFGLEWAMSNPHSPQLGAQLDRARMLLADSDKWWNSFRDLPKTPELQRLTDDLDAKHTAVRRDGIDKLVDAIRTGNASWMDESRANRLIGLYTSMNTSQSALEDYLSQQASDANERSATLFHTLLVACIGSILVGLTVAFISWRTLRRSIRGH